MPQNYNVGCGEIWGGVCGDDVGVTTSGVRASLFCRACDGGKGGDIYYFSVCDGDLLTRIAVADVMGHGSAVSATSESLYGSLQENMNNAEGNQVLSEMNQAAIAHGFDAISTAAVAGFYHPTGQLFFSYAGHHPLLIRKADSADWREAQLTSGNGTANGILGFDKDTEYTQSDEPLEPGDTVFLYTDGVVEAMDPAGQLFGLDRLLRTLRETSREDTEVVKACVLQALRDHTRDDLTHDDVTFMAVEIL